jgi:hypothetical protein
LDSESVFKSTFPSDGFKRPAIVLKSVVLPEPLGPVSIQQSWDTRLTENDWIKGVSPLLTKRSETFKLIGKIIEKSE